MGKHFGGSNGPCPICRASFNSTGKNHTQCRELDSGRIICQFEKTVGEKRNRFACRTITKSGGGRWSPPRKVQSSAQADAAAVLPTCGTGRATLLAPTVSGAIPCVRTGERDAAPDANGGDAEASVVRRPTDAEACYIAGVLGQPFGRGHEPSGPSPAIPRPGS